MASPRRPGGIEPAKSAAPAAAGSATAHRLRRPLTLAAAAILAAGIAVSQAPAPAGAEESTLPAGLELPVPATDVSQSDSSLAATSREVVAVVNNETGAEVVKLRANTQADAEALALQLDSQPGVTATLNRVTSLPARPSQTAPATGAPHIAQTAATSGNRAAALTALSAEAYGTRQWGLTAVQAEQAWAITRGSSKLVVAVIDTGVDATHPDLAGRILPQIDLVSDGRTGDPEGHGTHVAGIIAASLDGSGVAGLANEVSVLPVRVLNAQGWGDQYTAATGIIKAVDAGAKVLNLSYTGDYNQAEAAAVAYAISKGVTVVAAGGNTRAQGNPKSYPAALPGVLGVSSLGPELTASAFANTGSYIDLAAPGEQILSTVPGGRWEYWDGTSMSAPFVAAAAALVRVANPTLSKSGVDKDLTATAMDDSSGNGRDPVLGSGLLQADLAVRRAAAQPGGVLSPPARVTTRATSGRSKLHVDVNPNKGSGYWTFQVQAQRADGTWATLARTYRTTGRAETATINLGKGTYRVVVIPKFGYRGTTSTPVTLVN